jgi:hypothetical protein
MGCLELIFSTHVPVRKAVVGIIKVLPSHSLGLRSPTIKSYVNEVLVPVVIRDAPRMRAMLRPVQSQC